MATTEDEARTGPHEGAQGELGGDAAREARDEAAALLEKGAKRPAAMSPDEQQSMLDWFLDDSQEGVVPIYPMSVNVGTLREDWRTWQLRPVLSTRVDELRRMCQIGNRDQRRANREGPQVDVAKFNALLVFEASADPDLQEAFGIVRQKKGVVDAAAFVQSRFAFKPLLVDQIAGEILKISGGDDEDVKTAREVLAAGN